MLPHMNAAGGYVHQRSYAARSNEGSHLGLAAQRMNLMLAKLSPLTTSPYIILASTMIVSNLSSILRIGCSVHLFCSVESSLLNWLTEERYERALG